MEVEQIQKLKRGLLIAAAVIVLAVVILWPGYSAYRHFQQEHRLSQAQAALAKADYRNAIWYARLTLQTDAKNVDACRVMAVAADAVHSPSALDWWHRVVALSPTLESKLALAAASMRYQRPPYSIAAQILGELAEETNSVAFQLASVELDCRLNRLASARAHMAAACQLSPTNKIFQLSLAGLQVGSGNATEAASARKSLRQFADDPELAPLALRSLAADELAHGDLAGAQTDLTRLQASPKAALEDRLQYLLVLKRRNAGEFAQELAHVQQSTATNAPAAAVVAGWMKGNGLLAAAVAWLKTLPDDVANQPAPRLMLADCYLAGQDWRALREMCLKGNWGEMEFLRLAFLSHAWTCLGEPTAGGSYWRMAVTATNRRLGALTALSGLAEQWGLAGEQEQLWWNIVQNYPGETWAGQALERRYLARGDTPALRAFYERQAAAFPKNMKLKSNLALVCLLLGTNAPQAQAWAAEAWRQSSNDVAVASVYAYSLGLQGKAGEGLAVLGRFGDDRLQEPTVALYEGVLLAQAGETAKAAEYLKRAAKGENFLPEEKALLESARLLPASGR